MNNTICKTWGNSDKSKNPLTGKKISKTSLIYKNLDNSCKLVSADEYLQKMANKKDKDINKFYEILVKSSI